MTTVRTQNRIKNPELLHHLKSSRTDIRSKNVHTKSRSCSKPRTELIIIFVIVLFGLAWYFEIHETLSTSRLYKLDNRNTFNNNNNEITSIESISKDPNESHQTILSLMHEIHSLKSEKYELQDNNQHIIDENNKLKQNIKLLQSNGYTNNLNRISYYFLYGYCNLGNGMYKYHYIIMDDIKRYIAEHYNHWIIVNISIQSFLIKTETNYTHKALLDFTKQNIPSINLNIDKYQWIIEPCCEKYYKKFNIKKYYHEQEQQYATPIKMPVGLYGYYGILTNNEYMFKQNNKEGYLDDIDRYEPHTHVTNINYHSFNNSKINKMYYLDIKPNVRVLNVWQNNTYFQSNIKYLQSLNGRPLLIVMSGETFDAWRIRSNPRYSCDAYDIHVQRTKSWPRKGCIVTQYMQGILQRDMDYSYYSKNMTDLMNYKNLIINKKSINVHVDEIFKLKKYFCSFPVKMLFMFGKYYSDALIRHVFHWMLSKYKHCDMIGLWNIDNTSNDRACNLRNPKYRGLPAGHHLLVECQREYKFSINMENTGTYGYTSEKIYTGLLANTIPIYFGNKDIHEIINIDRIIYCDINNDILVENRKEWNIQLNNVKKETGIYNPGKNKTVEIIVATKMLDWAKGKYGKYLQKCVDEVINVDQNDTLYKWKLSQPIVPNNSFKNSYYDGYIVVKGIIDTMKYLKSPLFE